MECEDPAFADGVEERFDHPDPERAGDFFIRFDQVLHLCGAVDDIAGIGEQRFCVLRRCDTAADAVEKRGADFILKLFDLRADVGLGIPELFGRRCEVAQGGDTQEGLQIPDFHRGGLLSRSS